MSDPRDPLNRRPGDPLYDPADPLARDRLPAEEGGSNAVWGWIAGIIVVIAILAVVSLRTTDNTVATNPSATTSETTGAAPSTRNLSSTPNTTGAASSITAPERAPALNPAPSSPAPTPPAAAPTPPADAQ